MKRFLLLSGSLLLLFLLTACGGSTEPAAVSTEADAQDALEVEVEPVEEVVEEEPEIEVVEEAAEEVVVEEDPQEEAVEAEPAGEETVIVSPTDFDLIGQTGRPQFINSYANW
ncbi:MAG: hypothetical protein AAGD96_02240 [Chloroflexota bacterium]